MVDLMKNGLGRKQNPASRSNQEQGIVKSIKIQKGVEVQPISISVGAGA